MLSLPVPVSVGASKSGGAVKLSSPLVLIANASLSAPDSVQVMAALPGSTAL